MPSTVSIVIDAKDKASADINKVTKSFGDLDKQTKSFVENAKDVGLAFQSWASNIQTVIRMGQAVYDFARSGAELELVEFRFDRLAESIGTTADVLLDDLRNATRGMYSDAELMNSAMDFMALGLAKNHDEAVRLATVSAGLNMNMNQLVLTLTNMTTMRFDAIGVSVDGFKEKVKALEDAGMSANDAFKEAFLQQAEDQLNRVGHAADTTAGQFMQAEAEWKNFADSLKRGAAEGLVPVLSAMNRNIAAANDYYEELEKISQITGFTVRELRKMSNEEYEVYRRAVNMNEVLRNSKDDIYGLSAASVDVAGSLAMTQEQIDALTTSNKNYLTLIGNITDEIQKYADKETDLQAKHDELIAKKQQLIAQGWGPESEKITEINAKLSENEMAMQANAEAAELAGRRRILSMLEQQLAIDGLDARETEYLLTLGLQWGVYSQQAVDAARAAQAEVMALTNQFNALPTERTIHINLEVSRNLTQTLFSQAEEDAIRNEIGFAQGTGGWRTVPPGHPNDSYPILLSSGERFAVVPRGESPAGFASGTGDMIKSAPTIVINVHSPVTVMDERNAIENLRKYVGQAFRQLKSEGAV